MCVSTNDIVSSGLGLTLDDYAKLDAELFAGLGVDAIKHDNCVNVQNTTIGRAENFARYKRLGDALNATGRPILYDVVMQTAATEPVPPPSYEYGSVWSPEVIGKQAIRELGNMWWSLPCNKFDAWSTCVDRSMHSVPIEQCYVNGTKSAALRGLLPMLDYQDIGRPYFSKEGHWDYGGPGGWNHLDQLAVCLGSTWQGSGLTVVEQHSQLALWSILASPLILAMDIRNLVAECVTMVTNPGMIAVSNDPAGIPGRRLFSDFGSHQSPSLTANSASNPNGTHAKASFGSDASGYRAGGNGAGGDGDTIRWQVWGRPLTGIQRFAIGVFNRLESSTVIELDFATMLSVLGFNPGPDCGGNGSGTVKVSDVWTGQVINTSALSCGSIALNVSSHAVSFLLVEPAQL
jgi:hypothetical protein